MTTIKLPLALAATFLWIGFFSAISFMEAWLKFRAPGISIPLGLGIGRLVFSALNKVEWVFALLIILSMWNHKNSIFNFQNVFFYVPVFILLVQTFWLLPALDARAELHIQGENVPNSNLHFYYVGLEIIKLICLTNFGIKLLNKN